MSFYSRFASVYESIFPFSDGVYGYLRRHLPEPPALLLDVGCGTGHYAGRFGQDGYRMTALDLDSEMVGYARQHYPGVDFRVMDMLDIATLSTLGPFAGITCIGNTAAHLTQTDFSVFVARTADVLRLGGILVLQLMNWDFVVAQDVVVFPPIEGESQTTFYRMYRDIEADRVTFATRLAVRGRTRFEDAVPLYPLGSQAIEAVATTSGLELVEHVGSYAGAPFDPGVFSASVFVFRKVG